MGYGPVIKGRQQPITPWRGSWAQQQQEKKQPAPSTASKQWPMGTAPGGKAL